MTDLKHLHPGVREKIDLCEADKINFVRQSRWICYTTAHSILEKLEDLVTHPIVDRMPGLLIIGKPNNGKTQLVRRFCANHSPDINLEGEHINAPVLFCEAPPSPNEYEFYGQILRSLYERVPNTSRDARRDRVIEVLKAVQNKVLIIDELHNILAGSSTKQHQFLNMIKFLCNTLKISIVGCGTEDLKRAIRVDPQIESRFTHCLLPSWKSGNDFKRLLKSFENILPLRLPSNLASDKLSKKILFLTDGLIGEVSLLLNSATIYCIRNDLDAIDESVISMCDYQPPRTKKEELVNF